MKKFFILLLTYCFSIVCYKPVLSSEIKFSGLLDISTYWIDTSFTKPTSKDFFGANQRLYLQSTFEASSQLKGVVLFEINNDWGVASNNAESSYGGSLGTDGKGVGVKNAYMSWVVPETNIHIRMGLQEFTLPGFVADSAILDAHAAGITIHTPLTDIFGFTAWWIRPYEGKNKSTMDTFGFSVPCTYERLAITPWGVYGRIGKNVFTMQEQYGQPNQMLFPFIWDPSGSTQLNNHANLWWVGLTGRYKCSIPFSLAWDFNYGKQSSHRKKFNREGWYSALLVQYHFTHATPGILGWYTSGDRSSLKNGSKRMPTYDSYWTGTSMGFDGYWQERGTGASIAGNDPTGTWGLAAQVINVYIINKLKHNLRFAWYKGTNNKNIAKIYARLASEPNSSLDRNGFLTPSGLYLTTKDSIIELNINSFYKIYENLTAGLELNWMHLTLDKNIWNSSHTANNAYRFICTLRYTF